MGTVLIRVLSRSASAQAPTSIAGHYDHAADEIIAAALAYSAAWDPLSSYVPAGAGLMERSPCQEARFLTVFCTTRRASLNQSAC